MKRGTYGTYGMGASRRLAGLALSLALASAGAWAQMVRLGEIPRE
jgi:hypothetical protein